MAWLWEHVLRDFACLSHVNVVFFFSFFKGRLVLEIFTPDCYAKLTKKQSKKMI